MKCMKVAAAVLCCLLATAVARADLAAELAGYDAVFENGVSGQRSSYYTDSAGGTAPLSSMFTLSSQRVYYPYVGTVPSPGGWTGRLFDQGAMGVKVDGNNLVVTTATAIDPRTGVKLGHKVYAEGDVFLTVQDSQGVREFALLNAWARRCGDPRTITGDFGAAEEFHTGENSGVNLEGHVVQLTGQDDVALSGGHHAYSPGPTPDGLDFRIFAEDGVDLGDANLAFSSTTDAGLCGLQSWIVQSWALSMDLLSLEDSFLLGMHQAASCANDQIGMVTQIDKPLTTPVPAPPAALLGVIGLGAVTIGRRARRLGKR